MPAGVPWPTYLKTVAASLLAMCAGAQVVHRYYQPDLAHGGRSVNSAGMNFQIWKALFKFVTCDIDANSPSVSPVVLKT
ncbi:uncharacterized protein LOC119247361 isoform X1 [Talpa occidentalis]|uniref:uncharacterized protein LOC119247361 isoform X1 n=1 Tax=Talpa occidentalis TaxID=50954 RepID=UPI0023F6D0BB|nr:uncharacterized protein LOC119247361 isoform X1 [Talpa occidentalis]